MSENNVVDLVPGKSDAEVAKDIKTKMLVALAMLMEIQNDAMAAGFHITYQVGLGPIGKAIITQLIVAKHY